MSESKKLFEEARNYLPAGVCRNTLSYQPYPIYFKAGSGCFLTDYDDHKYLDLCNNYTALILGHAHPEVNRAITNQLANGTSFGGPTKLEQDYARLLIDRIPSLEQIRFTCSGSEAVFHALRLSQSFTSRQKVVRFDGSYHGWVDQCSQKLFEFTSLPYNNAGSVREFLEHHHSDIAAVIVEPMLGAGGMIPAQQEFLEALRELTEKNKILLIFDEIITFRYGTKAAQGHYQITPDLTTLGKIIGGGLPIGAFGGRKEIMSLLENDLTEKNYRQSGTFSGNPVSLAAGMSTVKQLNSDIFGRLKNLGDSIRQRLNDYFQQNNYNWQLTGHSSLFKFHSTSNKITDYQSSQANNKPELILNLYLSLLEEGIVISPRGLGCLSTPMNKDNIEHFMASTIKCIKNLKQ